MFKEVRMHGVLESSGLSNLAQPLPDDPDRPGTSLGHTQLPPYLCAGGDFSSAHLHFILNLLYPTPRAIEYSHLSALGTQLPTRRPHGQAARAVFVP